MSIHTSDLKQKLLLEYALSSPDTFAVCKGLMKPEYFSPSVRKAVGFTHKYYDEYHTTPTPTQVLAETGVDVTLHQITKDQVKYCSSEIEAFAKRRALELAILESASLIDTEDYSRIDTLIKDAIGVSLQSELGLDYFSNPTDRMNRMLATPQRIPTKWTDIDDLLGGGLARTELILLSANSGGGKSITLANLALNLLTQPKAPGSPDKLNVLYISLELSEDMIAQRFDTMLTGISSVAWASNVSEITNTVEMLSPHVGSLTIKRMPVGTNAYAIRAYLKEFELKHGYVPDVLVIDYLDLMGANEKVSADNVFEKDKRATEQLRDILFDYNMIGATASQQNRSAIDAQELNQGHIAGGISKVNTVDWYLSIILTPTMKLAGEIGFLFLKSRSSDAVGKQVFLRWDNTALRILNREPEPDDAPIVNARKTTFATPRGLTGLFDVPDEPSV